LALVASIVNYSGSFLKNIEKYWSFVLIPVVFLTHLNFYNKNKAIIFEGLLWGTITTLILCYLNLIYEMYSRAEPLNYFFRWRHLNQQFTEIADTHPAYLGLFITVATAYLFMEYRIRTVYKIFIFIFFSLAMFQLASRMALVTFTLCLFTVITLKHYKNAIAFILIISFVGGVFVFNASEYLSDRLFSYEQIGRDSRMDRLEASYDVFKENIFFGIGFSKVDEARKQKYHEHGFEIALVNNYNSHNQFMEYLVVNGIFGGLTYVLVFAFLFYLCLKQKDYLFFILFLSLFVANLTESMLVRIKGIEFFAIFATLYLSKNLINSRD